MKLLRVAPEVQPISLFIVVFVFCLSDYKDNTLFLFIVVFRIMINGRDTKTFGQGLRAASGHLEKAPVKYPMICTKTFLFVQIFRNPRRVFSKLSRYVFLFIRKACIEAPDITVPFCQVFTISRIYVVVTF